MKRKLLVLMTAMMAAVSPAWARVAVTTTAKIGDIYYNLYPDGHAEVGYNTTRNSSYKNQDNYNYSGVNLEIPETVFYKENEEDTGATYNVTAIGQYAFWYGDYALERNNTTKTITIPKTVKTIGMSAFRYMTAVETINFNVVKDCDIKTQAFASVGKAATTQLVLGADVTEFPGNIVRGFNPSKLTIPSRITKLGNEAFYYCSDLTSVTFESDENLKEIGENAFQNCKSLGSITLPNSVTTLGSSVFSGCSNLTSVVLSDDLETLGTSVFSSCTSLQVLTIPNKVTTIGSSAFSYCNKLNTLYVFPTTPPTVGSWAFDGVSSDLVVYVRKAAMPNYSRNYSGWNNKTLVQLPSIKYLSSTNKKIELNVTSGFGEEFLESVLDGEEMEDDNYVGYFEFKGTPTAIPSGALSGKATLIGIEIPSTITSIGADAFKNCSNLSTLTFLTSSKPAIPSSALSGTPSGTVYVREIARSSFGTDETWEGKTIETLKNIRYTSVGDVVVTPKTAAYAFGEGEGVKYLGSFYDGGEEGNRFGYLEFKGDVTEITQSAFYNNTKLKSIILPSTITKFGVYSFDDCTALTSINIPAQITTLPQVFDGCTSLSSVTFDSQENLTKIEGDAFKNCTSLTSLVLPESITVLESNAFRGTGLTEFTIPASVTTIGKSIFESCSILQSVYLLKNSTTGIDKKAFQSTPSTMTIYVRSSISTSNFSSYFEGDWSAENFTEVKYTTDNQETISPNVENGYGDGVKFVTSFKYEDELGNKYGCLAFTGSVTTIPGNAFQNCTELKEVYIPETVTSFGDNVFSGCEKLKSIVLLSTTPAATVSQSTFTNSSSSDMKVYVSHKGYASYKTAENWEGISVEELPHIKYTVFGSSTAQPNSYDFGENVMYMDSYLDESESNHPDYVGYIEFLGEITKIPSEAFKDNHNVRMIELPRTITEIGESVFEGTYLHSINIPEKVTKLEKNTFKGCESFSTVTFDSQENLKEFGESAFEGCYIPSFELPASLETIGDNCFKGCSYLETLTLNADLKTIGTDALSGTNITTLNYNIPNATTLTNKPYEATNLTTVNIGENVQTIPASAFAGSKIASIDIPAIVESIGADAFHNCSSLAIINVSTDEPATLGENAFEGINKDHVVNVPLNGYFTYKADEEGWGALNLKPMSGTLALNDEVEYTIADDLDDCTLSYTRNVLTDNWMGVYLPFDVTVTKVEGTYSTLESVSEGYINWTTVETGTIQACTPFIYKPTPFAAGEESRDIVFSATGAQLHSCTESNPATADGYTLHGNFTEITTMKTLDAYALASNVFKQADSDNKHLKPFRVYIVAENTSGSGATNAPALRNRINGEEASTIDGVTIDQLTIDDCMYNLQGVRVDDSYKGIVIVNGKKVTRK